MVGLRERRHQETKARMVQVGFGLFVEHGFDNVTMEAVAQAAGVSRSTAYRRFATKEDLVLEVPRQWFEAFDEALENLDDDTDLALAIRTAYLAVAVHIDDNMDLVRDAYRVLDQAVSLSSYGAVNAAWLDRLVRLIGRFGASKLAAGTAGTAGTAGSVGDAAAVTAIAGAYLGAIEATMQLWAENGGRQSVAELTEGVLQRLEPML